MLDYLSQYWFQDPKRLDRVYIFGSYWSKSQLENTIWFLFFCLISTCLLWFIATYFPRVFAVIFISLFGGILSIFCINFIFYFVL